MTTIISSMIVNAALLTRLFAYESTLLVSEPEQEISIRSQPIGASVVPDRRIE